VILPPNPLKRALITPGLSGMYVVRNDEQRTLNEKRETFIHSRDNELRISI
jgi:hypothetical protein